MIIPYWGRMKPIHRIVRPISLMGPILLFLLVTSVVGGFPPPTTSSPATARPSAGPVVQVRREGEGLIPPSDPDAESWLKKARDAAADGQWKLAADTLARVIEQYGDKTVSPDGRQFFSAVTCALDQVASWPPEGLETYRLLYDAVVQQQLARARATCDVDSLREIVRKYPLTTPGPESMSLLADWLIDARRPGEALAVLKQLQNTAASDSRAHGTITIPLWRVQARIVMAEAMAGEIALATSNLKGLAQLTPATSTGIPADWPRRMDQLSAFVQKGLQSSAGMSDSGTLGTIDPAVTPEPPWHDVLPGSTRINQTAITKLIKNTGRPVVWQAASDGRAVFVSTPEGLVARDLSSFELLWKTFPRTISRDPQVERVRMMMGVSEIDNRDRLDELSTRTLFHEYRGAVTTALGLVFVIEQGPAMDEMFPNREGIAPPNERVMLEANSIRAFEADSGRALWTIGRGGRGDDGPGAVTRAKSNSPAGAIPVRRDQNPATDLRHAHFFSPPIAAGQFLIAPYQLENDFYLAVLDRDGSVLRRVLIGSGHNAMMPVNALLTPLVHDDTVYISTGAGLFVALSRFDFSLKWLTMYDRVNTGRGDSMLRRAMPFGPAQQAFTQPDEWIASAPVVVGGLIVLGAQDSNYLQAFDRFTGQLKWSFPRGDYRYVIGADDSRVFIAGKTILAIDAAKGNGVWSATKYKPTGRPILCQTAETSRVKEGPTDASKSLVSQAAISTLLVPTEAGLLRLNAQTGKPIGELLPSTTALGNLAYIDGALYSIGPRQIAKYPDLEQSRSAALAMLKKNPQDHVALLRLAWLAKLQKQWNESLELLDQAEKAFAQAPRNEDSVPSQNGTAETFSDRVAHQRVEILLQLASAQEGDSRADLIYRAVRAATSPNDLLFTGMALTDLLADQEKRLESFKSALDLLTRVGGEPIALEPDLTTVASVPLRERLQRLWTGADGELRGSMENELKGALAKALSEFDLRRSSHISDGIGFSKASAAFDLAIGQRCRDMQALEWAASYLDRASRRGAGTKVGRDALLNLFLLYQNSGVDQPAAPRLALQSLERLKQDNHLDRIPADIDGLSDDLKNRQIDELASQFVASPHGSLLPEVLRDSPVLDMVSEGFAPSNVLSIRETRVPDAGGFFDRNDLDGLARGWGAVGDMVPLRIARQIRAVDTRAESTRFFWGCNLEPTIEADETTTPTRLSLQPDDAVFSENMGVVATSRQILGLGLTSGSALWPPIPMEGPQDTLPQPCLVALDGIALIGPQASTLMAVCVRPDAGPLWRRRFPNHRIATLAVAEGYFVAVDDLANTVFVIDPQSGRVHRQMDISESPSQQEADAAGTGDDSKISEAFAVIVGRQICRTGYKKVVTRDILTGRTLWELSLKGRVTKLMPLDNQHVGICYRSQHFAIVRADSGEIVRDELLDGFVMPPEDATLDALSGTDGGRVLLFANTDDDPPEYALVSIPLRPGAQIWKRPLGRLAICNRRMMRMSSRFVPVLDFELQPGAGRNLFAQGGNSLEAERLEFFDKMTGAKLLGEPFLFDNGRVAGGEVSVSRIITDIIVLNRRIVALCADGYHVLKKTAGQKAVLGPRWEEP
jgi:outer membrane protein assembly factor BamB